MPGEWTEERRAKSREAIRRWAPWTRSTGPKTAEGKAVVSRNAYKGGDKREERRERLREINRRLAEIWLEFERMEAEAQEDGASEMRDSTAEPVVGGQASAPG